MENKDKVLANSPENGHQSLADEHNPFELEKITITDSFSEGSVDNDYDQFLGTYCSMNGTAQINPRFPPNTT